MRLYTLDVTDLTTNANKIKEEVLLALERDGLLKKPAAEICTSYAVTMNEPGWFGRLFRKVIGEKEGSLTIRVMREV